MRTTMSTRNKQASTNITHVAIPNTQAEANATLVIEKKAPVVISPTKQGKYKYFIFELKGGHADEYITGQQQADNFQKEFSCLISNIKSYSNKQVFEKAVKESRTKCTISATAKLEVTQTPHHPNTDNDTKRILERISTKNNVDSFKGNFHTNSRATEAFLAIRLTGIQGDDHWCWKPNLMCDILTEYFRINPVQDETVQQALLQLKHAPLPDPDDSTGETQKYVHINVSGKTIDIPIFIAYTFLKIPVDTLTSSEEEAKWITRKTSSIFNEMKTAMMSSTFEAVMISVHPTYSGKVFDKRRPSNIHTFLKKAITRIEKVDHLTKLLTRASREDVTNHLWASKHDSPKYCSASDFADDDDDDTPDRDE